MSKQKTVPGTRRRERKVSGSITLADVARIAGVAISTASRAINSPEIVSLETVHQVKDAISRTGYVPNALAGGLASNRSRLVTMIIPTLAGPVFSSCVQAITTTLAEAKYQLMIGETGYIDSREDELLATIIGRRPAGVILTGIVHSQDGRRRLAGAGIPVVETWDLTPTPIDMLVGFSHEKIGIAVAEFFHTRGRRKLGLISANDTRALLRNQGFIDAAKRLGVGEVVTHLSPAPATFESGRIGLTELIKQMPDLDSVACSSDMSALGVLTEARARGVAVPSRLSVVGFGDFDFAAHTVPSLSSVRVDGAAIGRQAATFILNRIAGKPNPIRVIDLGFSIVERASV